MAVFKDFTVDASKTYVLRVAQEATASSVLRKPEEGEFLAVTWNGTKLIPVYFTSFDDIGEAIDPVQQRGTRVVGTHNGAEFFIIHHPTHGLRKDLEPELRDWVKSKHPLNASRKIISASGLAVGEFLKGPARSVEKILGKWPVTPKPAAAPSVILDTPPPEQPRAVISDAATGAATEVARAQAQAQPTQAPPQRVERDPRSLPPTTDDGEFDDLPSEVRNFEGIIFRGTVARIRDEEAQFRHITPDSPIPELREGNRDKDAFAHFNQVPEAAEFREGDQVEFELEFAPNGRIQVKNAWRRGEARPAQVLDAGDQYQGEGFDAGTKTARGEVRRDRRGRIIIDAIPIPTPFPTEFGGVVPGGAWRPVKGPLRGDPNEGGPAGDPA